MSSVSVICIGEVLFDNLADQLGKSLAEVTSWTSYPGGAPANVACALQKLGTEAGFIGCVGHDESGRALVEVLKTASVNLEGLQSHPSAPTRLVYVTRTAEGDRTFAGFGQYDTADFADTRLSAKDLSTSLFHGAQFLVTGTLGLAYPSSRAAIYRSVELSKAEAAKVVIDVNWRPVFWHSVAEAKPLIIDFLHQAEFIKLTDEEAEWLFNSSSPEVIAETYPQVKGVLVTAGEKGCCYWLEGSTGQLPAFSVSVVDTTGAGDSFLAGFLHQLSIIPETNLADAAQARQIVRYAGAVGALTTLAAGAITAQPTPQMVADFLELHPND